MQEEIKCEVCGTWFDIHDAQIIIETDEIICPFCENIMEYECI